MVFKLIRIDTTNPLKIQLKPGTHRLGRGADVFECDDKRVSRNHGEMTITDDTIVLKSLHRNPCFYVKKSLPDTQILQINNEVELLHGDKFGLLPDLHWYEIIHCTDIEPAVPPNMINIEENLQQNELEENEVNRNGVESDCSKVEDLAEALKGEFDETVSDLDRAESPSLLPPDQNLTQEPATQDCNAETAPPTTTHNTTDSGTVRTPNKRDHSPNNAIEEQDVKKVKTEPEDIANNQVPSLSPVKTEPLSPQQGPSNNQAPPLKQDASANNQNPQTRERCMYGAQCYRKNPQHKAQFSHPCDSDWGSGAQIPCPWGAGCSRTDPRHFRDHSHPENMQALRRGKAKRPRKKVSSDEDREASPVPELNLPAKRTRKTVERQSWSGDDSENAEEDPYMTDGSDDWTPTGKDSEDF